MTSRFYRTTLLKAGALSLGALLVAMPTEAQAPGLAMLGTLTKGAWTLRDRDDGSVQRICVRDGREFIQLRHKQPGCSPFVVRDDPGEVVVQYTCPGNGYGRTSVRRESSTLVQIQSQGIIDGGPFSITGEARHAGSC